MAICTATVLSGGLAYVVADGATDPASCAGGVLLSAGEYRDWQALLTAFGFDQQAFSLAFLGALLVFGVGLGIGLVVAQVRKTRL